MLPEELYHPLLQPRRPRNSRGLRADSADQPLYVSNERTFYGQTTLLPPPNLARVRAGRTTSPSPGLTSASSSRPITSTVVVDRHGKRKKKVVRQDVDAAGTAAGIDLGEGPSRSTDTLVMVRRESRDTDAAAGTEQNEAENTVGQLPASTGRPGGTTTTREERLRRAQARAIAAEQRASTGEMSSGTREGGLVRGASMRRVNVQESIDDNSNASVELTSDATPALAPPSYIESINSTQPPILSWNSPANAYPTEPEPEPIPNHTRSATLPPSYTPPAPQPEEPPSPASPTFPGSFPTSSASPPPLPPSFESLNFAPVPVSSPAELPTSEPPATIPRAPSPPPASTPPPPAPSGPSLSAPSNPELAFSPCDTPISPLGISARPLPLSPPPPPVSSPPLAPVSIPSTIPQHGPPAKSQHVSPDPEPIHALKSWAVPVETSCIPSIPSQPSPRRLSPHPLPATLPELAQASGPVPLSIPPLVVRPSSPAQNPTSPTTPTPISTEPPSTTPLASPSIMAPFELPSFAFSDSALDLSLSLPSSRPSLSFANSASILSTSVSSSPRLETPTLRSGEPKSESARDEVPAEVEISPAQALWDRLTAEGVAFEERIRRVGELTGDSTGENADEGRIVKERAGRQKGLEEDHRRPETRLNSLPAQPGREEIRPTTSREPTREMPSSALPPGPLFSSRSWDPVPPQPRIVTPPVEPASSLNVPSVPTPQALASASSPTIPFPREAELIASPSLPPPSPLTSRPPPIQSRVSIPPAPASASSPSSPSTPIASIFNRDPFRHAQSPSVTPTRMRTPQSSSTPRPILTQPNAPGGQGSRPPQSDPFIIDEQTSSFVSTAQPAVVALPPPPLPPKPVVLRRKPPPLPPVPSRPSTATRSPTTPTLPEPSGRRNLTPPPPTLSLEPTESFSLSARRPPPPPPPPPPPRPNVPKAAPPSPPKRIHQLASLPANSSTTSLPAPPPRFPLARAPSTHSFSSSFFELPGSASSSAEHLPLEPSPLATQLKQQEERPPFAPHRSRPSISEPVSLQGLARDEARREEARRAEEKLAESIRKAEEQLAGRGVERPPGARPLPPLPPRPRPNSIAGPSAPSVPAPPPPAPSRPPPPPPPASCPPIPATSRPTALPSSNPIPDPSPSTTSPSSSRSPLPSSAAAVDLNPARPPVAVATPPPIPQHTSNPPVVQEEPPTRPAGRGSADGRLESNDQPAPARPQFEYTDLDVLVSRLDSASHYEAATLLQTFLGPSVSPGLSPSQFASLPRGTIVEVSRRTTKEGKVKIKLSCPELGARRVDRCTFGCMSLFKKGEVAVGLVGGVGGSRKGVDELRAGSGGGEEREVEDDVGEEGEGEREEGKDGCGHLGCLKCAESWFRESKTCPVCRAEVHVAGD